MDPLCRHRRAAYAALAHVLLALVALLGVEPARAVDAAEQAIVDAVRRAYALEQQYWRDPLAFPSWDALYAHYRRGFSANIAEEMTEFTLSGDGDLATWIPDTVHVIAHDADTATAWFPTPPEYGLDGIWGFEPYMVVRLRREDGGWIIYWAGDSATLPTE